MTFLGISGGEPSGLTARAALETILTSRTASEADKLLRVCAEHFL